MNSFLYVCSAQFYILIFTTREGWKKKNGEEGKNSTGDCWSPLRIHKCLKGCFWQLGQWPLSQGLLSFPSQRLSWVCVFCTSGFVYMPRWVNRQVQASFRAMLEARNAEKREEGKEGSEGRREGEGEGEGEGERACIMQLRCWQVVPVIITG